MAKIKFHFLIHEVCALTGFSKYMLDYLAREKIYVAGDSSKNGRGVRRQYTYVDLVLLRALKAICDGSGKIRHLTQCLSHYRERYGEITPETQLNDVFVSYGGQLFVRDETGQATDALTGQMVFAFHVDLALVTKALAEQLEVDPETKSLSLTKEAQDRADGIRDEIWARVQVARDNRIKGNPMLGKAA